MYTNEIEKLAKITKRVARHILHDDEEAEEISQETLLLVWRHRDRIDDPPSYASTLAYRSAVAFRARRERQDALERRAHPAPPSRDLAQEIVNRHFVEDILKSLPRQQARALTARYLMDMSVDEVAAFLDVSRNSAKTHLRGGLANARRRFRVNGDSSHEEGN